MALSAVSSCFPNIDHGHGPFDLQRLVNPQTESAPKVLFSLSESVASLPVPTVVDRISVKIDLDKRYTFYRSSEVGDMMLDVMNPEDGALYSRLWKPAADRLIAQMGDLDDEKKALVLSVLALRK